MNENELRLSHQKWEKIASGNSIAAIFQIVIAVIIACFIYFIRKTSRDIVLFAGPGFVFGLLDVGTSLFARHRVRKIRDKEIIYKVMND